MFKLVILAVTIGAVYGQPQSSSSTPICVMDCLSQASAPIPGCGLDNFTCVCKDTAFQQAAQSCLAANCTASDQKAASAIEAAECTTSIGAPLSSAGASTTGSASSAQVTGTSPSSSGAGSSSGSAASSTTSSTPNSAMSINYSGFMVLAIAAGGAFIGALVTF